MVKRTVRDLPLRGKRVLLRADFNVPLQGGAVADDTRIRAALPTIRYLLGEGAAVVVCAHLGRPRGYVRDELRLAPVAARLSELLSLTVTVAEDSVGASVEKRVRQLRPGDLLLLENLRFHPEEEANAPDFARQLAAFADCFVNDAFGAAHRAHASTEGVARYLDSAAGLLMAEELERLGSVFSAEVGTRAALIGGAKISDKLVLLRRLIERVDILCIGGAMAHTFLLARGLALGASLVEPDLVGEARTVLEAAASRGCILELPIDGVIGQGPDLTPRARPLIFAEEEVESGWQVLDIGPATVERFSEALRPADVIVWNGPLGLFEQPAFAGGTRALARTLAGLSATTVICGGETAQAVHEVGVAERIDHISTGGGAALELLEGRTLPGVAVLPDRV